MESKTLKIFDKLSFLFLLVTVFGSFFFFIPFAPITLGASKGFLLSIGVTLSFFCWLVSRMGEGTFKIPRDRLIVFAAIISIVFLVASFFSSSRYVSFFGSGFEIGTFGSMLTLFLLFFLSSIYFQTEKRLWYFLGAFFAGSFIVVIFQLTYLFVDIGNALPSLFQGISGNLIGSWNDLALFFGLIILMCILTLEFIPTKRFIRIFQYFLLVASLFFIAIINTPLVWILVGIFSVILFVYRMSLERAGIHVAHDKDGGRKFPIIPLVIILLSFAFIFGSSATGALVSKYINFNNPDVRPSLSATSQIAIKALKQNPFFGTGPNTFATDWDVWRPKDVAQTAFWNTSFPNGYGLVPTFLATTGVVGLISILLFLIILFIRGLQSFRIAIRDTLSNYFILTTLLMVIYSWVTIIVYTPTIIMLIIAFASSGTLIGILVYKQVIEVSNVSYLKDPRKSFFSILGLVVLIIVTLSVTYSYVEKLTSIIFFSRSLNPTSTIESLVQSENKLKNAIVLDGNDAYYRTLSQVYVAQMAVLVSDKTLSVDTLKSSLQQLINQAQASAIQAVNQNPKQYLNQLNLGNIYAALVPLLVTNSYENATAAYAQAVLLAPNNPSIPLAFAVLEYSKKNEDGAKSFINQALSIKSNYTDALFFLAEIEIADNDSTSAINTLQSILSLDPSYINARYLLAQTYQKVGRTNDAKAQYQILQQFVPDNESIKSAINSLSAGPAIATPTNSTAAPKAKSDSKAKN